MLFSPRRRYLYTDFSQIDIEYVNQFTNPFEALEPRLLLSASMVSSLEEWQAMLTGDRVASTDTAIEYAVFDDASGLESLSTKTGVAATELYDQGIRATVWQDVEVFTDIDRWLVKFAGITGTASQQLAAASQLIASQDQLAIQVSDYLFHDGMFALQTAGDVGFSEVRSALMDLPGFSYVEPEFVEARNDTIPDDPDWSSLWAMTKIDAPAAWDITTGSQDIVVAVLDTGADWEHEDLAANIWTNDWEVPGDGIDNDGNGLIDDYFGWDFGGGDNVSSKDSHGTHVAGTIGAVGDNGIGVVGVNWNVKIMNLDVFPNQYTGSTYYIAAMGYMAEMKRRGVNVVASNNSYGSQGNFPSSAVGEAVQNQAAHNILFVAAAGNDSTNNDDLNFQPAGQPEPNAISVAASTTSDGKAGFSNWGATTVHITAPGTSIRSTTPNDNYGGKQGTSMASPHVAGLVGLAYSVAPNASYHQIRQAIFDGGDPINWGSRHTITDKRINAANTIDIVRTQINGSLYVDANANSLFDSGEVNATGFDAVNKTLGDWKVYVDEDSDGQFDLAESWTDSNPNGFWDAAEPFVDTNSNGTWDVGESYTDRNQDGVWNDEEAYVDANGNGVWDDAETYAVVQFNGEYTLIVPAGTYDIRLAGPGSTTLTQGATGYTVNINAYDQLGGYDFGIDESEAPVGETTSSQWVVTNGKTDALLTVRFSDNFGIDVATLGNDDIEISRGGFTAVGELVSYKANTYGTIVEASYRFDAPGGSWDAADDGNYTVRFASGSIADVAGNVASGNLGSVSLLRVTPVSLNYSEGFESGSLSNAFHTISESNGRVQVTNANTPYSGSYHVTMDAINSSNGYALNQLIFHADLAGYENVNLDFWWKDYGDETDELDTLEVSVDQGLTWHRLRSFDGTGTTDNTWQNYSHNLDNLGLLYSDDTWIRFQQYDNFPIATDGFAIDDISLTGTLDTQGPRVTSQSPSTNQLSGVSQLSVEFDEAIDPASFDLSDIAAFTGPAGDLLASITGYHWLGNTTLIVEFAEQTAAGTYQLTLGPSIVDAAGNAMDQNNNGTSGESGDSYTASFNIQGPRVTSQSPNGNVIGAQSSITLTFNRDMNAASFAMVDDIISFTGPLGDLSGALIDANWSSPRDLVITFTSQNVPGDYALTLAPTLTDTVGNALDQDVDLVGGETTDDQYVASLSILGARVTSHTPSGNVVGTQSSITLSFNVPMNTGTFAIGDDINSFTGTAGDLLSTITGYQWLDSQTLEIQFASQSLAGSYSLSLGPNLADTTGNLLDQDQDGNLGEPGDDGYIASFDIANEAPTVMIDSPTLPVVATVDDTSLLIVEATANDDGNGTQPLDTLWSVISTPTGGIAVFDDATADDTAVAFTGLGEYVLQFEASDGDLSTATTLTVNVGGTGIGVFVEQAGQVVMEAENESGSAVGSGAAASSTWVNVADASRSGGTYIIADPNTGVNVGDSTDGPRLDYDIQFTTTGTYYAWVLMTGAGGNDDSIHLGMDGTPATYGNYGMTNNGAWQWIDEAASSRVSFDVTSPGLHTVNLWMREDGTQVDKIILTTDAGFTPSGLGPAESTQGGNVAADVNAPADDTVIGNNATLSATATDDGLPNPPAALTYQWVQIAGPGTASFTSPDATSTDVAVDTFGQYTFRLIADDGQVKTADNVTINFDPGDVEAPTVTTVERNDGDVNTPDQLLAMTFTFNEDVAGSIDVNDLSLSDASTGQPVDISSATMSYDAGTHTARWDLSAVPVTAGYYNVVLAASGITDAAGNSLDGDGNGTGGDDFIQQEMVAFPGDANLDGTVNVLDLSALANHYNLPGGWSDGDFNQDALIDVLDLSLLALHYNQALTPPLSTLTAQSDSSVASSQDPNKSIAYWASLTTNHTSSTLGLWDHDDAEADRPDLAALLV